MSVLRGWAHKVGAKTPLIVRYAALALLFPLAAIGSFFAQLLVLACLIGLVQVADGPLRGA